MNVNNFERNEDGWVTGGTSELTNTTINWQSGPVVDGQYNGATIEEVLQAALDRLEAFQDSPAKCEENQAAIDFLDDALIALRDRTARRIRQVLEGSYAEK
jgi:hypothetical protein